MYTLIQEVVELSKQHCKFKSNVIIVCFAPKCKHKLRQVCAVEPAILFEFVKLASEDLKIKIVEIV